MQFSRGNMHIHRLFSVRELGIGNPEPHLDRVIQAFLNIGEAIAARWIQMPKAVLLLQMAPENSASGAIYLYSRPAQEFYMISFDGADDSITIEEFLELLPEYGLLQYAEQPVLLQAHFQPACAA
jgi:hypothetical protein